MREIKRIKVRFISDTPCIYLKKGEIYEAFRPLDDCFGKWWAIYIEEDDDPGDYAFPSEWFEIVE